MKYLLYSILLCFAFSSCIDQEKPRTLPPLGNRTLDAKGDTLYPTIPDFSFINQDGQKVDNQTFKDKIYIVDFFFIHCPTICPKVKKNGLRLYERFKNDSNVVMLSHSIDTKNDTVAALKVHAQKLGIENTSKWHLVTGNHDEIYAIADDYFSIALVNPDAPGGFDHSGRIILVDQNRHVRSFCDGTDAVSVDKFMLDVDFLLKENKNLKH
jgi:protein SCO1